MEGIYAIKSGDLKTGCLHLSMVADKLKESGAEAIIAGCTEVPLVLKSSENICVIDPTEIVAKVVIKIANKTETELIKV